MPLVLSYFVRKICGAKGRRRQKKKKPRLLQNIDSHSEKGKGYKSNSGVLASCLVKPTATDVSDPFDGFIV